MSPAAFVIMILPNSFMFVCTSYNVYTDKKKISGLKSNGNYCSNSSNKKKQGLFLYFTFFFLMGLTRIPDVLNWFFQLDWLVTMVSFTVPSEGILLFIILICKPKMKKEIYDKLCFQKK
ncbi:uncharacterized protein LOC142320167 [Lycorma delicatula]|uniref:uncharacterized protein LOC142320167 n=1 Tax=Lycorma delicatula TaxID=130591 RepID=UPI003F512EB9